MARGRKPKIDAAQMNNIFRKYAATCRNEKISYNNPIFTTIAQELKNEITPYSLFMRLKRNFKTIFGQRYDEESSLTQSTSSSPSCRSPISSPVKCTTNEVESVDQYTFLLDIYDWKKFEPLSVNYVRRDPNVATTHKKYKTLPKYKWSCLLREKLWESTRLPCTWVFKTKRIDEDHNVLIKGKCSQCSSISEITSKAATDKIVTITCNIFKTNNNIPHNPNKKTKLTPYKRRQLAKKLQYKPATVVQKEIACAVINDDDTVNCPVIPTLETLRKVKHERRQINRLHSDPIMSILMMSIMATYQNFVREFTLVPSFHLCYWCEQQMEYYKAYIEKIPRVTMTVDATGSFFRTLKLPDGSLLTKRMFLYVAMVTSSTIKSTAICQLITDNHTTDSILSWLKRWHNEVRTAPHEIVTDDSSALIAANVQAFTTFQTVRDYLRQSFLVLMSKSNDMPEVFLRLDTSHFVKNVYNLRCFDNVDLNIKMFYIRSILFIKECESFKIINAVLGHIIKICTFKYAFTSNETCKISMQYLKSLLVNTENPVEENDKKDLSDYYYYVTIPDDDDIIGWFDELVNKEKILEELKDKTEKPNDYYLPNLVSTLKRLMIKLPLWSNVMCPFYKSENKSPTSSAIESYFKTLKHLLFETRLHKYNVDEFIKIHYNFILGETRIAAKNLNVTLERSKKQTNKGRKRKLITKNKMQCKKIKMNTKQSFSSDSIFTVKPSYTENWGGEGYSTKNISVLFLRNGNLVNSINKSMKFTNTCAFDSVFFLVAFAYKQNVHIKKIINTCASNLIREFIQLLTESLNLNNGYDLREEIIAKYYKRENNIYRCESNMAFIFEHILLDYLYSANVSKECVTETCANHSKRTIVFLSINMEIVNLFGIGGLEDAVIIDDSNFKICLKCNNESLRFKYELSDIILFDLNGTDKIKLEEIPQYIQLRQKKYRFIGAVEYVPPVVGIIGHYKCHCLINNSKFICYDDNKTETHESSAQPLTIHNLMYGLIDDD